VRTLAEALDLAIPNPTLLKLLFLGVKAYVFFCFFYVILFNFFIIYVYVLCNYRFVFMLFLFFSFMLFYVVLRCLG